MLIVGQLFAMQIGSQKTDRAIAVAINDEDTCIIYHLLSCNFTVQSCFCKYLQTSNGY